MRIEEGGDPKLDSINRRMDRTRGDRLAEQVAAGSGPVARGTRVAQGVNHCAECGQTYPDERSGCPRCARIARAERSLWVIPVVGLVVSIIPWVVVGSAGVLVWFLAVGIAWGSAAYRWARLRDVVPKSGWTYSDSEFLGDDSCKREAPSSDEIRD
jgi:hypothetical protein